MADVSNRKTTPESSCDRHDVFKLEMAIRNRVLAHDVPLRSWSRQQTLDRGAGHSLPAFRRPKIHLQDTSVILWKYKRVTSDRRVWSCCTDRILSGPPSRQVCCHKPGRQIAVAWFVFYLPSVAYYVEVMQQSIYSSTDTQGFNSVSVSREVVNNYAPALAH
jgi:hypothetical protein